MAAVRTRLSGPVIGCADAWELAVDGLAPMSAKEQRREQFLALRDRAVALGARVAEHQPQPERLIVMLDPAGHPFCLFPGNV